MFQPGLKDKIMTKLTTKELTFVITTGYRSFWKMAWFLLSIGHRQTDQGYKIIKEQLCQYLQLLQSSTEILSRSALHGSGTARRALESARQAMMPQNFTHMEAKRLRTNYQSSLMGRKLNSERPTRSTEGGWSVRSITETRILQITSLSGSDRLEFEESRL